jgi:hypothetical protein
VVGVQALACPEAQGFNFGVSQEWHFEFVRKARLFEKVRRTSGKFQAWAAAGVVVLMIQAFSIVFWPGDKHTTSLAFGRRLRYGRNTRAYRVFLNVSKTPADSMVHKHATAGSSLSA